MSYSGSTSSGLPPFDPWLYPELFRGVLTRRVFAEILTGDYVAQALVPPSERITADDTATPILKVDLRNYVYDGEVLLIAARLYQGQTTNFRTPGGGFAPVFYPTESGSCGAACDTPRGGATNP